MTLERQVTFWIAALAIFVAVLWLLSEMLLPFAAGMVLAYLLDPLARRVERLGVSRGVSALVIVTVVVVVLVVAAMLVAPVLINEFAALLDNLPGYVMRLQSLVTDPSQAWLSKVFGQRLPDASSSVGALVTQSSGWITTFLTSLWSGGRALFSILSLLVITPVVAFYLLYDWDSVVSSMDSWIPLPHRQTVRTLAREIDEAIAGFVRGQVLICLILAAFYAVALTFIGLNFGFLIGLMIGFFAFVPYVGSLTGAVIGGIVTVAQFWPDGTPIMIIIIIFVVGQAFESYVLSPKLVGAKVGLHPVWLMFSLIAFGYLFGFLGLLIAIPVAAAIGVLLRFGLRQYLASPIYTGEHPHQDPR